MHKENNGNELTPTVVGRNLQRLIDAADTNPTRLALETGVPQPTIHRILSGESRDPRTGTLKKLAARLGTTAEALRAEEVDAETASPAPDEELANDYDFIPRYNVRAAAGAGANHEHELVEKHLAFRSDWLRAKGLRAKDLKVIVASGESMEPRIQDGDILLVDVSDREPIKNDKVYAVLYEDAVRVKRLYRRFDGTLILHSDNPIATPRAEEVPPEKQAAMLAQVIGRVVWAGGDL